MISSTYYDIIKMYNFDDFEWLKRRRQTVKSIKPKQAKMYSAIILIIGIIVGVFGLAGSDFLVIAGMVIMVLSIVFKLIFYVCPHCNKYLDRINAKYCPYCGKEIDI